MYTQLKQENRPFPPFFQRLLIDPPTHAKHFRYYGNSETVEMPSREEHQGTHLA